jgi:hypothetical protein
MSLFVKFDGLRSIKLRRDRASQDDALDVRLARFFTRLNIIATLLSPGATATLCFCC